MKKYTAVIIILLVLVALMYSFVYFFVLPKTAQALVPVKMERKFSGKKRDIIEEYLGNPSTSKDQKDIWIKRTGNYVYSLTIQYNAADSTAKKYSLQYTFKNNLFHREETIYTDSAN